MRLSDLLGTRVLDEAGRQLGHVHDVRLRREGAGTSATYHLTDLVVGPWDLRTRTAHAWGYAEGRARGPGLLSAALRRGAESAKAVPATEVIDWGAAAITVNTHGEPIADETEHR